MSFDVAAAAYDEYMGRWSRLLSAGLADVAGVRAGVRAGVSAGMRVLDVGCGTGALTEELVRRVGAGAVSAVDPSASFVRAMRDHLPGVDVREASAERLPFEDGTFDAALAQLVVHFLADPVAGITEMRRVTRPGGAVAACVWDFGGHRGPLGVFWDAAREVRPDVVDESGLAGTRDGQLVELFRAAGLRDVSQSVLHATVEHHSFAAWWAPFTKGVGPGGAFVAQLDPEEVARLRDACERRLGGRRPIVVRAAAWAARGVA
jgi:ubiquinone/menaquinone biosynthesis C-methylase UbiE